MTTTQPQPLVLVLCTGNSCRSHIAEGILRAASKGQFRVASTPPAFCLPFIPPRRNSPRSCLLGGSLAQCRRCLSTNCCF